MLWKGYTSDYDIADIKRERSTSDYAVSEIRREMSFFSFGFACVSEVRHIINDVQRLIFVHINQKWVVCKASMINCRWHDIALGPKAVEHS